MKRKPIKTIIDFHSLDDTNNKIKKFAFKYRKDTDKFKHFSIRKFFNFVAVGINYKLDPKGIELVQRPLVTLKRGKGDCDCKTVLFLAYLINKGIPCGFSIVGGNQAKNYHHVFPFIIVNGKICNLDATYSHNQIYDNRHWKLRRDVIIYRGVNIWL